VDFAPVRVPRLDGVRVAVINWRDPWQSTAGGAELYAWQICRQLQARGAIVHFVTSRESGQPRGEERSGVRISRMGGTYTRYPRVLAWLFRHRSGFDVAIDCMNGIPFFSPLALNRKTKIILLVHHVHDRQFFVYFGKALATLGRFLEGPVARRVYRGRPMVAVSPSTARALREQLRLTGPISLVPNGAPRPATPPRPAGPAAGPSLVFVGRLVAHKRVDQIIRVAETLRERWPGLRLDIVGRGEQHESLAAQIRESGLEQTVMLHGFLPEEAKNSLLAGADLHISASRYEGWGLSVIEAAAFGVPTVAYDVNGLRDAIRDGDTGWLAVPGEDLADTVQRALKELHDPARRVGVSTACTRWAGEFTWDSSGERMARLIQGDLDEY
jgi:glycosyltransferase involved in cell wall biosynthesis